MALIPFDDVVYYALVSLNDFIMYHICFVSVLGLHVKSIHISLNQFISGRKRKKNTESNKL